jgi:tight adherence protein B
MFFKVTSPEFIGRLYGNPLGVIVMTAALVLYGAAFFLGMKIVEIEV